MENNHIMRILAAILLIACTIVGVTLFRVWYEMTYVPSEAVSDLVEVMERAGIHIDRNLISRRQTDGWVYVFASEDYAETVAELLSDSQVQDVYAIPDGELVILKNGDRVQFGENFTFRYHAKDGDSYSPNILDLRQFAPPKRPADAEVSVDAVRTFLKGGSRSFGSGGEVEADVSIEEIWEYEGIDYILCSRTIDDMEITGNLALCTVENGKVTAAYGTWCFFTSGMSYSAQLTDILNILFNVKKDLAPSSSAEEKKTSVTIESIKFCYSLYFFGEENNFCLIPCWQIATDTRGDFVYNAINGALYTKNMD